MENNMINISRICIGTGVLISVIETIPTMLYGLDSLYPKPDTWNVNDEILKFKHCFPFMLTGIVGVFLIVKGVNNIV